ncbi:MAG TPA: LysM peptidoglycan-binding domain-containing protein [Bacteroidetes bacterium]|nr:LysM peptidoglycan-binding domain-containing protein [Bacteroidota bacterium]
MLKFKNKFLFFIVPIIIGIQSCQLLKSISKSDNNINVSTQPTKQEYLDTNYNNEIDTLTVNKEELTELKPDESILPNDDNNNSTINIDTTGIIEEFLNDSSLFSRTYRDISHFKNRNYSSGYYIAEDSRTAKGSGVLAQLDSLVNEKFYKKYYFESDPAKLNIYNYSSNEIPEFTDSVYNMRIERLNLFTPFNLTYNEHVKSFIKTYAVKRRKLTSLMLGLKEIYFPLFEEVLDKYNMPLELKYLPVVESALNPTAGSRAGAKGLWQFMYNTGKVYGLQSNSLVDDRFDPYKSTEAAAKHLKDLYEIYGTWDLALAAYNSGPGNVNRAIRAAGGVKDYWAIWPFLPKETRGYVPAFIAVNYIFNYASEHNIYPMDPGILYNDIDSVSVHDVLSFDQISEFLNIDMDDLRFLNPAYKQGIIPATSDRTYILRLPREKIGQFLENETSIYNFKSSKGIEKEKLLAQIKKAKERTIHIVKSGENLGLIARKYRTTVGRIKRLNRMRSSRIYPGQKLIVYVGQRDNTNLTISKKSKSKGKFKYHTIKQGDTLWDLSQKYNASISQIRKWNGIRNSHRLKPGEKLIVGKKG